MVWSWASKHSIPHRPGTTRYQSSHAATDWIYLTKQEWVFPRTFREPQDFIDAVVGADTKASAALGMGTDIRFDGTGIVGGALLVDSRLVHAVAFPASP